MGTRFSSIAGGCARAALLLVMAGALSACGRASSGAPR